MTNRWQKFTNVIISPEVLGRLSDACDEFLIHAADVEGKCSGVEVGLIKKLAEWSPIPTTYAGGVRDETDLQLIKDAGKGKLDVTIGSALDIFGGKGLRYEDTVSFCR